MHTFGQLLVVCGISITGAAAIIAVVRLIFRPDPYDDPDYNPFRDDYG